MGSTCPSCGREVMTEGGICPFCGASLPAADDLRETLLPKGSPWERREELGALRAYWQTWKAVLTFPGRFFANLEVPGALWGPFLFGLITGLVGSLINMMWQVALLERNPTLQSLLSNLDAPASRVIPVLVALLPLAVSLQLFFLAGVYHVMILLLSGGGKGFSGTFGVVCYAAAPDLFYAVPFCGGIVAGIWSLFLTIVGLREVHQISGSRAALAVLVPLLSCIMAGLVALYLAWSALLSL